MRIVGGRLKGRAIRAPSGVDVRPTSDRARESLFNILLNGRNAIDLSGATVLDVYAGTGALGLEALSRGATHAVFVDNNRPSIACIKDNADAFDVSTQVNIVSTDARVLGKPPPVLAAGAAVVFLDPPYREGLVTPCLVRLLQQGWIAENSTIIVETEFGLELPPIAGLMTVDSRKYGAARLTFMSRV